MVEKGKIYTIGKIANFRDEYPNIVVGILEGQQWDAMQELVATELDRRHKGEWQWEGQQMAWVGTKLGHPVAGSVEYHKVDESGKTYPLAWKFE